MTVREQSEAAFLAYERVVAPVFEEAISDLAKGSAADASMLTATLAPQSVDELLVALRGPVLRAVVLLQGVVEETPYLLCLTEPDARTLADAAMGSTSQADRLDERSQASANQFVLDLSGAIARRLSNWVGRTVTSDLVAVEVVELAMETEELRSLSGGEPLAVLSARYAVGVSDVTAYQVLPAQLVRTLAGMVQNAPIAAAVQPKAAVGSSPTAPAASVLSPSEVEALMGAGGEAVRPVGEAHARTDYEPAPRTADSPRAERTARPVRYEQFGPDERVERPEPNYDLISDIPIEVSVELGRATRKISEIMRLGVGETVRLDRLVDEPVDVVAGGRTIARGEVVVVDDSFAVLIRELLPREGRSSDREDEE